MLVNDIWGGEVLKGGPADWNTPIWKHDLDKRLRILRLTIETHPITPITFSLLIDEPGGLLIEVTDGTADYNASRYRLSVFYDLAKVAVNRLAFSQGHELRPHGATAVAVTPGWLRSEMMLDNFGVSEVNWRDALDPSRAVGLPAAPPDFALSESPRYVGRAVVALASDPDRTRWNQKSVNSRDRPGNMVVWKVRPLRADCRRRGGAVPPQRGLLGCCAESRGSSSPCWCYRFYWAAVGRSDGSSATRLSVAAAPICFGSAVLTVTGTGLRRRHRWAL